MYDVNRCFAAGDLCGSDLVKEKILYYWPLEKDAISKIHNIVLIFKHIKTKYVQLIQVHKFECFLSLSEFRHFNRDWQYMLTDIVS